MKKLLIGTLLILAPLTVFAKCDDYEYAELKDASPARLKEFMCSTQSSLRRTEGIAKMEEERWAVGARNSAEITKAKLEVQECKRIVSKINRRYFDLTKKEYFGKDCDPLYGLSGRNMR